MERIHRAQVLTEAGLRHGFSTRLGGVSQGRFASLNLASTWGDDPQAVAENLRLLAADAGFDEARMCQMIQVHGRRVLTLSAPERRRQEGDGMATLAPLTLSVLSADCVSILLGDGQGPVAAVHAGWRGTIAGVAQAAVAALVALGAEPRAIRAALGPSIGPCCFEVQRDVAAQFQAALPDAVRHGDKGRLSIDLWAANRAALLSAGLDDTHIDWRPPCTMCDEARYFSYRRDGARIGQHLSFITGGSA